MSTSADRVEVFAGIQRRRRYTAEQKVAIVQASQCFAIVGWTSDGMQWTGATGRRMPAGELAAWRRADRLTRAVELPPVANFT